MAASLLEIVHCVHNSLYVVDFKIYGYLQRNAAYSEIQTVVLHLLKTIILDFVHCRRFF
jgi:hypothetical protein